MGLGQMLMALLATVLLSMLILNMNKNSIILESSINEYKVKNLAINLAQSIIDDAQNLRFDESISGSSDVLGLDTGESFAINGGVDDFDDYNGFIASRVFEIYKEQDKEIPKAVFNIRCNVEYVNISNLEIPVAGKTLYKRMEVRVWSDAYINPFTEKPDTVKLSTICGDWPQSS